MQKILQLNLEKEYNEHLVFQIFTWCSFFSFFFNETKDYRFNWIFSIYILRFICVDTCGSVSFILIAVL